MSTVCKISLRARTSTSADSLCTDSIIMPIELRWKEHLYYCYFVSSLQMFFKGNNIDGFIPTHHFVAAQADTGARGAAYGGRGHFLRIIR